MRFPRILFTFSLLAAAARAQTSTTISVAGSGTWTAPAGVTSIKVECWGGGGAGATRTSNGGGGGGGGGAYAARLTMAVTPGVIYNYTVGAAGVSGGANGGTTTFTGNSVQCVAAGGASVATDSATGGAGGLVASSTGDVGHVFAGGAGASGSGTTYGGGGGGSGGSASAGNAATNATGATAVTGGGPGGAGKTSPQGAGSIPANGPGGGGGGGLRTSSGTRSGGAGYAGAIRITYNTMTTAVADGIPVLSAADGLYTNNSAKTASVVENIPYTPSEQSRWGAVASNRIVPLDIAGLQYRASVSEGLSIADTSAWLRPAKNWAVNINENIPYVSSDQSRWGMKQSTPLRIADASVGVRQAFFHAFASVTESIPYVPATRMEWGAAPTADSSAVKELNSTAVTPNPGEPVQIVPRRPIHMR